VIQNDDTKCFVCGKSLKGKKDNAKFCSRFHKDYYHNHHKEDRKAKKKRLNQERLLRSYEAFKKANELFFRDIKREIIYEYEEHSKEKMPIRLPLELVKYHDGYSFSNSYQKLIKADLIEKYPEMKEYLK